MYTLQEKPSVTLTPFKDADVSATLRLKPKDVEEAQDLPPSIFPCLDSKQGGSKSWQSTQIPFKDATGLQTFCSRNAVSALSVLQTAWALVLARYIGNPSVCFACEYVEVASDGSNSVLPETQNGVCKANLEGDTPVIELVRGLRARHPKTRCQLLPGQIVQGMDSHSPETLPANSCLLFRHHKYQGWLDTSRSLCTAWEVDDRIDVSSNQIISLILLYTTDDRARRPISSSISVFPGQTSLGLSTIFSRPCL